MASHVILDDRTVRIGLVVFRGDEVGFALLASTAAAQYVLTSRIHVFLYFDSDESRSFDPTATIKYSSA